MRERRIVDRWYRLIGKYRRENISPRDGCPALAILTHCTGYATWHDPSAFSRLTELRVALGAKRRRERNQITVGCERKIS